MIRGLFRNYSKGHVASLRATSERTFDQEFRASVLNKGGAVDHRSWTEFRNSVLKSPFYSQVNVDATILGLCNRHGDLDVGRSYVQFLAANKIPLTAAIAGKYLKLFKLRSDEKSLNEAESKEVLEICRRIREKHPILDGYTTEHLIYAICLTDFWRESLELLEHAKEFGHPSNAAFNDIAQAAFRHDEFELAVNVLENGISAGRLPNSASLTTWITCCGEKVTGFLNFLQRHSLQISDLVATKLKSHLEKSGIHVDMSSVSRNQICGSCTTPLNEITLEPAEFELLQKAFHEKVLVKENIFIKSTPQEFNEFQRFLDRTGPFDCVIDGLNVAYSVGANRPVNALSGHILTAMKHFTEQKKRVLILGREHMKRWPHFIKRVESNDGQVFLTENLSEDDPYFIYAALKSGPTCDIFTRDLLRTHAHQLGPHLGSIFRRWQRIHQWSYKSPTTSKVPKLFVQQPVKYKVEVHMNDSGFWHVPWTEEGNDFAVTKIPEVPFEVPVRWMCFKLP